VKNKPITETISKEIFYKVKKKITKWQNLHMKNNC
jgi:hypothetical protein